MDRAEFKKKLQEVPLNRAAPLVNAFLNENGRLRDYHLAHRLIASALNAGDLRIAQLSSFTLDQLTPLLETELFRHNLPAQIRVSGFNQYEQEIVNPASGMYAFKPHIILLALRLEELAPSVFSDFSRMSQQDLEEHKQSVLSTCKRLIQTAKANRPLKIILTNFTLPMQTANGLFDWQDANGQIAFVQALNQELRALVSEFSGVYLFDMQYEISRMGMEQAYDAKLWFTSGNPFSGDFLIRFARRCAVMVKSIQGVKKKCLVLDLDNTLWGGVIGEDGMSGIAIGHTYPGNVFRAIQQTVKNWARRGVILALNSKNNLADVKEVFETHPDMVLRWDDFSALRVNWQDKVSNLRELADELNIGLDSMVFVDDNPAEIELARQNLPQVETLLLDGEPLDKLNRLHNLTAFENVAITESDRNKGRQYKAQAERRRFQKQFTDLTDFYRSLNMKAEFTQNDTLAIKRLTQLTQKTNQFNLTTRRYTESEMEDFLKDDSVLVLSLRLKDRFGDNGITGLIIAKFSASTAHIDTFLLSCRIIGRTAETAMLSVLCELARKRGVKTITGEYIPTRKNSLIKDVYKEHGFVFKEPFWELDVSSQNIPFPEWIEREA